MSSREWEFSDNSPRRYAWGFSAHPSDALAYRDCRLGAAGTLTLSTVLVSPLLYQQMLPGRRAAAVCGHRAGRD
jgi:hypothetical protein